MGKPKGKGGKKRRKGKNFDDGKRELVFKEDGLEYAQVIRMFGNGRLEAYCFDGIKRQCHIRGKLKRRVWINAGDIILISLRDFQDGKADIIHKYYEEEAKALKAYGELPESAKINEAGDIFDQEDAGNEDAPVTFTIGGDGDEDDSDDDESDDEPDGKKAEIDIDASTRVNKAGWIPGCRARQPFPNPRARNISNRSPAQPFSPRPAGGTAASN